MIQDITWLQLERERSLGRIVPLQRTKTAVTLDRLGVTVYRYVFGGTYYATRRDYFWWSEVLEMCGEDVDYRNMP